VRTPLSRSGEGSGAEPHGSARRLRKSSPRAEDILWDRLRGSRFQGAKFKRQVPMDRYIADFYGRAAGWVGEIDGRQHAVLTAYDEERTKVLEAAGAHVLRFTNEEACNDLESVLARVAAEIRLAFG
jgi:very-short-patch-repair endonuclease